MVLPRLGEKPRYKEVTSRSSERGCKTRAIFRVMMFPIHALQTLGSVVANHSFALADELLATSELPRPSQHAH
tara:strand:+ start:2168 stop:2386 length:219 start_codon:yes stop_codon:yes gene_type:complete